MSTKATSTNTETTPAGKSGSPSTPKDTDATMGALRKALASHLVALETELDEATREAGLRWHAFPYLAKSGNLGLVVTVYHPEYHLGMDETDNRVSFLVSGRPAREIATSKIVAETAKP